MGDFNASPTDDPIKLLSKNLDDSFNEFAIEKPFGTFNGFELNSKLINRIDYIFTKNLHVYEYKHIYKKLTNSEEHAAFKANKQTLKDMCFV